VSVLESGVRVGIRVTLGSVLEMRSVQNAWARKGYGTKCLETVRAAVEMLQRAMNTIRGRCEDQTQ